MSGPVASRPGPRIIQLFRSSAASLARTAHAIGSSGLVKQETLQTTQAIKLQRLLRETLPRNPFIRSRVGEDPTLRALVEARVEGPDSLRRLLDALPPTTRAELQEDQARHPPYGTNLTYDRSRYVRLHQTSGTSGRPLRWLDTAESWAWYVDCWKKVYRGVGLRPDDRLFLPFSFGPFIGFWGAFEGAGALGNFCVAGGGMTTRARLDAVVTHDITVVCCTPTYALRMAEVAREEGVDLAASAVRALVVAGEPGGSIEATRRAIERAWGARVFDHCGMTEIGAYAYECGDGPGGLHVLEEDFIVEVLEPGGDDPVASGEPGELVLTGLGRLGSPLLRYRTGDLVRVERSPCPIGYGVSRLAGGILGRVDDMVFIRGNNVYPGAVESVVRRFDEVAEYRVQVLGEGELAGLSVELDPVPGLAPDHLGELARRVESAVRDRFHFRPSVRIVTAGSLPRFELKARRFFREPPASAPGGGGPAKAGR